MLQIQEVDIGLVKPYDNNPRQNDNAVEKVAKSIKEYGFRNPIIVDGDNVIIAGHTRLRAAKSLGLTKVPVVVVTDLSPEKVKAFRLDDNKTAEFAEWDLAKLGEEFSALQEGGFDLGELAFSQKEIDEAFKSIKDDEEAQSGISGEDEIDDAPEEAVSEFGRIYRLGNHLLMCGDSTNKEMVSALTGDKKIDFVLSDPPYGMNLKTDFSAMKCTMNDSGLQGKVYKKVHGDCDDFTDDLITTFFNNIKKPDEMILFGADYFAQLIPNRNDGSWLVWDKRNESQDAGYGSMFELAWSMNRHKRRILRFAWFGFLSNKEDARDAQNRVHPTQKPVSMLVEIINTIGNQSKTVLDLYGGSGSTLIACENTNRKCYMMEYEPTYCDVIRKRWAENTNGKGCNWEELTPAIN